MSEGTRLTEDQGRYLLGVARQTIEQAFSKDDRGAESSGDLPEIFNEKRGTFVTLTEEGKLRGCIGHIVPQESLIEGVRENAVNAAFRDPRFPPLRKEECDRVRVEISILTEPSPLDYESPEDLPAKLRPHTDGLIIKKGPHQATFLPQVWDQLEDKEQFLTQLCLKAGLNGDAWRSGDLEVLTYQAQAFEE